MYVPDYESGFSCTIEEVKMGIGILLSLNENRAPEDRSPPELFIT